MPPLADPPANASRRSFLKGLATLGTSLAAGALLTTPDEPAQAQQAGGGASGVPGSPKPWHAASSVYGGSVNLSTNNTQLVLPVCGWGGLGGGLSFALVFNSQSVRASAVGAKWTHSLNLFLTGSNPVVFVDGDGSETAYTLTNGAYAAPAGCYDTLVQNVGGTWTLARKGGVKCNFTSAGVLGSIADNNGLTTSLTYTNGLLTTVTDAANRTLTLGYAGGQLTSVTDCQNKTYTLAYANSLPTSLTTPPLSGQTYSQQIGYGSNNNVTSLADRLGRTWGYTYNGSTLTGVTLPGSAPGGFPHPVAAAANDDAATTAWPANATNVQHWHDANGNVTQYGIDNLGRLVATQDSSGNQTVHTYDNSHNRTATQLPSGNTWHSTFDAWGNNLVTQDPLGNQTTKTYDGPGGRLLTSTDANGSQTQYGYDANGNTTSITDAANNTVSYGVNNLGQQTGMTDAENRSWLYGFDANGFANSVQDALGGVTQYVSNSIGQKTQRTDARSRVTNYTLDDWGRATGIAYPTSGNASLGYSYNAAGQLTQTSDGTGIRTYQYNTLGQRTGMTDPRGNTGATYDGVGNLLTQTDVSGRQITNALNTLNQLTQVTDGSDNASATFTYTVDGQPATVTYPNGTKTTYGYDNAGRATTLSHTKTSDNSLLVGYTAVYDNGGRITQVTEQPSGDVTTYTYDGANNPLSETRTGTKPYSGAYTYDRSNRRLTARTVTNGVVTHNGAYSYDAAGRLTQVVDSATTPATVENYIWNADGTLASSPGPQGSGYTRLMEYDEEQHLFRIKHSANGSVTTAYEYGYAADGGRRWQKDYAAGVWTWYPCGVACSAGELVEQTSDLTGNAWTTSALYMKAGSACGASLIRRNGECHHFDMMSSLAAVTDSNAAVLANRVYNVFGVGQYTSGNAQTQWTSNDRYTGADNQTIIRECPLLVERDYGIIIGCRPPVAPVAPQKTWTCTTSCNVDGKNPQCTGTVSGTGTDSTEDGACKAAKKDAASKVPQGCQAKHCKPCQCSSKKITVKPIVLPIAYIQEM